MLAQLALIAIGTANNARTRDDSLNCKGVRASYSYVQQQLLNSSRSMKRNI